MRPRGQGGQTGRTARPQPEGTGRRRSACGPDGTTHAWQISARQKNEGHHRHNRRNMAQPDTTTVVATSAAAPWPVKALAPASCRGCLCNRTVAGRPGTQRDPAELTGQRPDCGVGLDDTAPPGSRRAQRFCGCNPATAARHQQHQISEGETRGRHS
jgi:hypothetical protein